MQLGYITNANQGTLHHQRERRRNEDIQQNMVLPSGSHPSLSCASLVPRLRHYGRWGLDAERYLNTSAAIAPGCSGVRARVDFISYWRKRFSIMLQKVNAQASWENLKD